MSRAVVQERETSRRKVSLAALLVIALLAGGGLLTAIKWQQDAARSAALEGLRDLGISMSISAPAGSPLAELTATRDTLDNEQIASVVEHMTTLAQPYDLGLSEGLEFRLIDLTATRVSPKAKAQLREAFPGAVLREPK